MPPREVYSVDFRNSNMTPVTSESWGPPVVGGSANGFKAAYPNLRGLQLHMTREGNETAAVSNSVYVLPPERSLLLDSRFRLRASFEQPSAEWLDGSSVSPESWAVALLVKFGGSVDTDPEPFIAVTCQFRRAGDTTGVRINGVNEEQKDQAGYIDSPIDYSRYRAGCLGFGRAPRFTMEMNFCGRQSAPVPPGPQTEPPQLGYAVASGSLSIAGRADHRVLSSRTLSTGVQDWIGALGISLATIRGVGKYRVRLLDLAIDRWDPGV
jgi:hypothetical protein